MVDARVRLRSAGTRAQCGVSGEIRNPSSLARAFTVRSCFSLSVFVSHRGSDSETIGVRLPRSRALKSMPRPRTTIR
jgi:hypothetical protein